MESAIAKIALSIPAPDIFFVGLLILTIDVLRHCRGSMFTVVQLLTIDGLISDASFHRADAKIAVATGGR